MDSITRDLERLDPEVVNLKYEIEKLLRNLSTYTQGMHTACALLVLEGQQNSHFESGKALEKILKTGIYDDNLQVVHDSCHILQRITEQYLTEINEHFQRFSVDLLSIVPNSMLTLFTKWYGFDLCKGDLVQTIVSQGLPGLLSITMASFEMLEREGLMRRETDGLYTWFQNDMRHRFATMSKSSGKKFIREILQRAEEFWLGIVLFELNVQIQRKTSVTEKSKKLMKRNQTAYKRWEMHVVKMAETEAQKRKESLKQYHGREENDGKIDGKKPFKVMGIDVPLPTQRMPGIPDFNVTPELSPETSPEMFTRRNNSLIQDNSTVGVSGLTTDVSSPTPMTNSSPLIIYEGSHGMNSHGMNVSGVITNITNSLVKTGTTSNNVTPVTSSILENLPTSDFGRKITTADMIRSDLMDTKNSPSSRNVALSASNNDKDRTESLFHTASESLFKALNPTQDHEAFRQRENPDEERRKDSSQYLIKPKRGSQRSMKDKEYLDQFYSTAKSSGSGFNSSSGFNQTIKSGGIGLPSSSPGSDATENRIITDISDNAIGGGTNDNITRIAELSNLNAELSRENTILQTEKAEMSSEISRLNSEVSVLKTKLDTINVTVLELRGIVDDSSKKLEERDGLLLDKDEMLNRKKAEQANFERTIANLEAIVKSHESNEHVRDLEKELLNCNIMITSMQEEICTLSNQKVRQKTHIDSLESQLRNDGNYGLGGFNYGVQEDIEKILREFSNRISERVDGNADQQAQNDEEQWNKQLHSWVFDSVSPGEQSKRLRDMLMDRIVKLLDDQIMLKHEKAHVDKHLARSYDQISTVEQKMTSLKEQNKSLRQRLGEDTELSEADISQKSGRGGTPQQGTYDFKGITCGTGMGMTRGGSTLSNSASEQGLKNSLREKSLKDDHELRYLRSECKRLEEEAKLKWEEETHANELRDNMMLIAYQVYDECEKHKSYFSKSTTTAKSSATTGGVSTSSGDNYKPPQQSGGAGIGAGIVVVQQQSGTYITQKGGMVPSSTGTTVNNSTILVPGSSQNMATGGMSGNVVTGGPNTISSSLSGGIGGGLQGGMQIGLYGNNSNRLYGMTTPIPGIGGISTSIRR